MGATRRAFLAESAAAVMAGVLGRAVAAFELPRDLRVVRVIGLDLLLQRSKVAGRNSHKDVHGDRAIDRVVRLVTNHGVEGIGSCRAPEKALRQLLGRNPFAYLTEDGRFQSPLGNGTMPLWDLLGKLRGKPVYELLAGGRPAGPQRVPVYDGSIYFADLLPEYRERWPDRLRREIDMGLEAGHRAFKVKIGRGFKWMPRKAGDRRDVEVLRVIRRHAGGDVLIGVDANNGFDATGAKRIFEEIGPLRIAFAEEMFPETVPDCLGFKAFLREHGWDTLVADGESQRDVWAFEPFVRAGALDALQADMNRFGFEGILAEAHLAAPAGIKVAPHNWGSLIGFYMQLHVGRAVKNFYRAEHDPLSNPALLAEGFRIEDGAADVPDRPGCGLELDEKRLPDHARLLFDFKHA